MLCGLHDSAWHSRRADALLKVTATTICGSDLHVLKGDVPSCAPGRILGHEAVGEVCESVALDTSCKDIRVI